VKKVVVKILQGSVVTQTVLGGLAIHPQVANFLQCKCAKNYANWLAVDKVIAKTKRVPVFLKRSVRTMNIDIICISYTTNISTMQQHMLWRRSWASVWC